MRQNSSTCGKGLKYINVFYLTGITDSAIYPLLALLVDQRHVATYGSVYAIGQFAICLAFFIGMLQGLFCSTHA